MNNIKTDFYNENLLRELSWILVFEGCNESCTMQQTLMGGTHGVGYTYGSQAMTAYMKKVMPYVMNGFNPSLIVFFAIQYFTIFIRPSVYYKLFSFFLNGIFFYFSRL